ncbi:hypothetical protein AALO_G00037060 [Alosa alosa]|uniref:Ig-like domain-containing protein n=1 Tax=Alosa alosa TaxID=278164 RepID=A0AAV6HA14_9TELE|nr:uncharacterized protein LOC125291508 isoform X1 [Alosa alosa]XP_048094178.1 uncharacterized protein LOC125291508 isoform X1 [Alosa alosa]KAG5282992.1 hypothetical protein AALO_G00037060 [Alosa alosa]
MAKRVHLQCLGLYAILLHFSSGDKVVSINTPLGENVMLHCNTSGMDISIIKWAKDGIQVFVYSPVLEDKKDKIQTNFTSERMSVDPSTTVLHISDVQVSDEGIYTCEVLGSQAQRTETWNLTITSVSPDPSQLIYISTAASGAILIIFCSILCIYKVMKKKYNSGGQASIQSNGTREGQDFEMSQQRQDQRISRQSSQYLERYNSVYGKF